MLKEAIQPQFTAGDDDHILDLMVALHNHMTCLVQSAVKMGQHVDHEAFRGLVPARIVLKEELKDLLLAPQHAMRQPALQHLRQVAIVRIVLKIEPC